MVGLRCGGGGWVEGEAAGADADGSGWIWVGKLWVSVEVGGEE